MDIILKNETVLYDTSSNDRLHQICQINKNSNVSHLKHSNIMIYNPKKMHMSYMQSKQL